MKKRKAPKKQLYTFPQQATPVNKLLATVKEKRLKDVDWHTGHLFCLIYHPGDEREKAIKAVFDQYYADSALNPTATPSLVDLETETVSMCADLLHGDAQVCGNISTGGTESIILAVKTARDWARKKHRKIKRAHVVLPESAHPAFMKAFHFLDMDFTVTKLGKDMRADMTAMEKAITPNTVLLVGSAPSYPFGIIDPITEIAALAKKKKLLCHVDACVGGMFLPFVKELGYDVPPFDFAVDGVTSMSADIHKYGYSPKGASLIMYSTHALRRFQFSLYTKWAGGIYGSPTITGTRSGSSIAGAWAAIRSIGKQGYMEMAKVTMETTERIKKAIGQMDEIEIIGKPDMSIVALRSKKFDVYMLADELSKKGWHFERQQLPPSLHFTVNYIHKDVIEEFLMDFQNAVDAIRHKKLKRAGHKITTAAVKGLKGILPKGSISRLKRNSPPDLNKENKAAMYGMLGSLSGTKDLEDIVLDFIDSTYSAKS